MANKTVTTSQDLETIIASGLGDGQNLTINSGTVTISQSPSIILGQVTSPGNLFVDGANAVNPIHIVGETAEEINVNGRGKFSTSLGFYELGVSDGTASQTFNTNNYWTAGGRASDIVDVCAGCWVETGRRINYNTGTGLLPEVDDWIYKVGQVDSFFGRIIQVVGTVTSGYFVVKYLTGSLINSDTIEVRKVVDNFGADYQSTWQGLANGVDVLEPNIFQGFVNMQHNNTAYLSQLGTGAMGFGFVNAHASTTMTFGDGTNGFIPPNSARIRLPMVTFATSNIANFGSGTTIMGSETESNRYNIETALGGSIDFKGIGVGSAHFSDSTASAFKADYCTATVDFGMSNCGSKILISNCIVASDTTATNFRWRSAFAVTDVINGIDIDDCIIGFPFSDPSNVYGFGSDTSDSVTVKNSIAIVNNNNYGIQARKSTKVSYTNMITSGRMKFDNSKGITMLLPKFQVRPFGGQQAAENNMIQFVNLPNGIDWKGFELLNGSWGGDCMFNLSDTTDYKFRAMGMLTDKLDRGTADAEEAFRHNGISGNGTISRCYFSNGQIPTFSTTTIICKNITMNNCSGKYAAEIQPSGVNVVMKGVHGGAGQTGSNTGLETDLAGSYGSHFHNYFRSDTTGAIGLVFTPTTQETAQYLTIVTGDPIPAGSGDLSLVANDEFIQEMSFVALGNITFTGVITLSRSSGSIADGGDEWGVGNVEILFQHDTGSGYNGTWLDLRTPANLTSITNMVDGIRLKVKIRAINARTVLNALVIHTTTSLLEQQNNLYPIDQVEYNFIISGTRPGSIVEIYDNEIADLGNNNSKLLQVNSAGTVITFIHTGVINDIKLQIIHPDYVEQIIDVPLTAADSSINIIQQPDTND